MPMPLVAALALLAFPADDSTFRDRVAPILERRCVACHNDANPKGKLSLSTIAGLRRGGEGGPAVEPGRPDESAIVEKIAGPKPEMPRNAPPLAADEVETIRRWVASGAHWPEGLTLNDRRPDRGPWWSLAPLRKPEIPAAKTPGWARNPIDAFILATLDSKGLPPSPEAERRTLIRRVTFDLTGLPPTPEEVEAFVNDGAADAYERVVDRLLASPDYGERWARHWLDLAHYGDTHGYDKDKRRDNAWRYRDYVIDSFNRDTPYARFVFEQLAGDLILPDDPRGIIATGFIVAGPWDFVGHEELREGTVEKKKTLLLDGDDMVTTVVTTFASLTIHCARCHDHKFDPIPQQDYYRLQAVFAGVGRGDRPFDDRDIAAKRAELARREVDLVIRRAALTRSIADTELRARLVRPGSGRPQSNGYHSAIAATPDATKWVQIDLGRSVAIDTIRLIPARPVDFPDTPGFGFPARYRLEIDDERDFPHPRIVSDRTAADVANPGDSAVEIPAGRATGRFVRVTATRLWPRTNDYVFALAELQVIADGVNVADGVDVTALDSIESGLWSRTNLVDGLDSRKALGAGPGAQIPSPLRLRLEEALGRAEAERIIEGLERVRARPGCHRFRASLVASSEAGLRRGPPAPATDQRPEARRGRATGTGGRTGRPVVRAGAGFGLREHHRRGRTAGRRWRGG